MHFLSSLTIGDWVKIILVILGALLLIKGIFTPSRNNGQAMGPQGGPGMGGGLFNRGNNMQGPGMNNMQQPGMMNRQQGMMGNQMGQQNMMNNQYGQSNQYGQQGQYGQNSMNNQYGQQQQYGQNGQNGMYR